MAKTRVSLDFTEDAKKNLDELQSRQSLPTVAELFRKAISLYDCITDHVRNGGKVILQSKDGTKEALKLL